MKIGPFDKSFCITSGALRVVCIASIAILAAGCGSGSSGNQSLGLAGGTQPGLVADPNNSPDPVTEIGSGQGIEVQPPVPVPSPTPVVGNSIKVPK
jgi:hypothetical protein